LHVLELEWSPSFTTLFFSATAMMGGHWYVKFLNRVAILLEKDPAL
jgi:hypothetical protein